MKRIFTFATITIALIAVYGGVNAYAALEISFVEPTPYDGEIVESSSVEIEVQITESVLADLTFNWNGKDYIIHDNKTVLMFNFDNVEALRENYGTLGGLVKDVSEWHNDGTLGIGDDPCSVPEWLSNGYYGGAFDFAGNGNDFGQSILVIPHADSLIPYDGDFAIAVWVRPRSDIDGDILRKGSTNTVTEDPKTWYKLEHSPGTSNNRFSLNFNTDGTDATVNSPQAYNDDQWHFVVAQRNYNTAELWIDGSMVGSTGVSGSIYNTANLTVGSKDDQADDFINATLDEVRLYMRSFAEDEMQILYHSNLSKVNLNTWFLYVNRTNLTSGDYTYQASANQKTSETEQRSVTIDAPPVSTDVVANADIRVAGTVSGSYFDTQSDDDDYETITERQSGGKPSSRHSYLEHKWTFNVPSGNIVTFYVSACKSENNEDDFMFAYSKDNSIYYNMVMVTKIYDDDERQSYTMPSTTAGTVYVRVVDTDRSAGNRSLDTIYVDDMYITSVSGGTPPTPNPMTWTTLPHATGSSSISMTATIASDPSGVEYYFAETSHNPGGSDSDWQDSRTYEDTDLQSNTTYTYQVKARDKSTDHYETELSSAESATTTTSTSTGPGQATDPTPFDGKPDVNRKTVTLNWTAGSDAASHNVYLGTSDSFGPEDFKGNQTSTSYISSFLRKGKTYYWRIDEVNSDGTTTGELWDFTTL